MTKAWTRGPWRWAMAVVLALLLHLAWMQGLRAVWPPLGANDAQPMRKMGAVYTRAVVLSQAPAVRSAPAAPPAPAQRPKATAPAASAASPEMPASALAQTDAASAASERASVPLVPAPAASALLAEALASAPPPGATASEPAPAASAALVAAAPASGAQAPEAAPFEWPRATRIRYRLLGQYRGEVHGHASVEWLREGERYQVHLDVSAGGVFRRVMSSEGRITAAGLVPERYVQRTELLFNFVSAPKTEEMRFGGPTIRLMNGNEVPSLPGLQDTASQFIQFIYLLSTRPGLQQVGHNVELALALPRSVRLWRYETAPSEQVATPAGPVETLPLRPANGSPPGDWTVAIWFAPRLQMLPVRFRIQQSAEVYFDLFIDQLPEQAGGR